MSGFSTYLDNKLLDHTFRGVPFNSTTIYMAAFTAEDGLSGNIPAAQKEVSTVAGSTPTAYSRIAIPSSDISVASGSMITNVNALSFPQALADWGTVSHVAIMDAATGGNVLSWGAFRSPVTGELQPREIFYGDQVVMRAGALVIELMDNPLV